MEENLTNGFNGGESSSSIDHQLRRLAPNKLSKDDRLVEWDAALFENFFQVVQSLHGFEIRETVCLFSRIPIDGLV